MMLSIANYMPPTWPGSSQHEAMYWYRTSRLSAGHQEQDGWAATTHRGDGPCSQFQFINVPTTSTRGHLVHSSTTQVVNMSHLREHSPVLQAVAYIRR